MRLIDADALIPMMKYATTDNEIGVFPIKIGFNDIEKVINEQPTVNTATMIESLPPAQPKTGKWIIEDNPRNEWYRVTCSECGENVTSTAPCIGFPPDAEVTWDYCPYCGAKMEPVSSLYQRAEP